MFLRTVYRNGQTQGADIYKAKTKSTYNGQMQAKKAKKLLDRVSSSLPQALTHPVPGQLSPPLSCLWVRPRPFRREALKKESMENVTPSSVWQKSWYLGDFSRISQKTLIMLAKQN